MAARRMLLAIVAATVVVCGVARQTVREYTIDLDAPPQERYLALLPHFNKTVWAFYDKYFKNDLVLTAALYGLTLKRGKEPAEMQAEVEGLAALSKLPLGFVHSMQMLYELQTMLVPPIVNFTGSAVDEIPAGYEALARIPWRGGCTGIIARTRDGTVSLARNLDFGPVSIFEDLVYWATFTKGGKEVFRSQMIAGYTGIVTAYRPGADGFAIERNTRYSDHRGGNAELLKHLVSGRPLNGWSLRKIAEEKSTYDAAVAAIAAVPFVSTEYSIVAGASKGTILSREPDAVAYTQTLGTPSEGERKDFIIMTNFDFFFHDVREWFDPTGGRLFRPRRLVAVGILNATEEGSLTDEVLFEAINAPGVLADTIFQAVINVRRGEWNVSQPDLTGQRGSKHSLIVV